MKKPGLLVLGSIFITLLASQVLQAQDFNDAAYQSRIVLKAETVLNPFGNGDCLIFPYYDARTIDGSRQVTEIRVENSGPNGIVARLRFRDWTRGKEAFYTDIWVPSAGAWTGRVEANGDGTSAVLTSSDAVVWRSDGKYFYLSNPFGGGSNFSTRNLRQNGVDSNLYGSVEVIGSEKTMDEVIGGKVTRLAKIERDCPNTLRGKATLTRAQAGVSATYDAVAIGNFSRTQGSLFKSPKSPFPQLETCEDSLDQLEFQLSKWEVIGRFSVNPSNQGKTTLIVTYPTKSCHYKNGVRMDRINNPFEAPLETKGETLKTSLSNGAQKWPADSTIGLPYGVNVVGIYGGSEVAPTGINNLAMPVYQYENGEVTFTATDYTEHVLIPDFEYFGARFKGYNGYPSVGLVLQETKSGGQTQASITPVQFSADWSASTEESITTPAPPAGPTFGTVNVTYTYFVGGAASTVGHPLQYLIDWGDGTDTDWMDVGVTSATHRWTAGGAFAVRTRARCSLHPTLLSKWSEALIVLMESVSAPPSITGPVVGIPNVTYTYSIFGDSVSGLGDPVQYLFEWGDGTDSGWLPTGVKTASKSWFVGTTQGYQVKAKARCTVHPLVESPYSPTLLVMIETITAPITPIGETKPERGIPYVYMTGGASSNIGDPIEYSFDWGDGTTSNWSPSTSATKTWVTGGDFSVKARARCAVHKPPQYPEIIAVSSALSVKIEQISKPTVAGPNTGIVGASYTYTASGATSNTGDPIQYQFSWGDGSSTGWLPVGTNTAQKTWASAGVFTVAVQARCSIHTSLVSDPSDGLDVTIEGVTAPTNVTAAVTTPPRTVTATASGATSTAGHPIQYQFDWVGDGSDLSGWISPVAGTATATKTYAAAGTYTVRARARCQTHPTAISDWSSAPPVTLP